MCLLINAKIIHQKTENVDESMSGVVLDKWAFKTVYHKTVLFYNACDMTIWCLAIFGQLVCA